MKKYLIAFLLFAGKIFSQQNLSYNEITALKYKKMKNNGIIMLSIGAPVFITGVTLYVSAVIEDIKRQDEYDRQMAAYNNQFTTSNPYGTNIQKPVQPDITEVLPKMLGGVAMGIVGGLATAGGTVMYFIGKKKQKRWSEKVSFYVAPSSFRIAYKF